MGTSNGRAVALVTEHGIAAVLMAQLAEGANVPRATLDALYPSVEHALVAWLDTEVAGFRAELAAEWAPRFDPFDRLASYLHAQCRVFAGDGPGLGGVRAAQAGPPAPVLGAAMEWHIDDFRRLVQEVLDAAVVQGSVRGDLDTDLNAALVVAALVDGARPSVASGRTKSDAAASEIMTLLRAGLGGTR